MEFEVLEHVSETGIKAYGDSIEAAFANAAKAMFSIITDLDTVKTSQDLKIKLAANNHQELLVDWLNELLFHFDSKGLLFRQFDLHIEDKELRGVARGEPYEPDRHPIKTQIKATTYYGLKIEEDRNKVLVWVYFDV